MKIWLLASSAHAKIPCMTINLSGRQQSIIQSLVDSGQFKRAEQVVETALVLLKEVQARKDLADVKNFHESLVQRLDEPTFPATEVYTRILNKIDAAAKA